ALPLTAHALPAWATPDTAPRYREVALAGGEVAAADRAAYAAELRALDDVGFIVDEALDSAGNARVFLRKPHETALRPIAMYAGNSLGTLMPLVGAKLPVLTGRDVTDVAASYVADPFLMRIPSGWAMFFEVMNFRAGKGEIGLATSADGCSWKYEQ